MKFRSATAAVALAASVAAIAVVGAAPAQAATKHASHTTEALHGYYKTITWAGHKTRVYHLKSQKWVTFVVSPNRKGEYAGVDAQVLYKGHWVKASSKQPFWVKLNSQSFGRFYFQATTGYKFRVHTVYNGDRTTKASVSAWQYFTVTK